MTARESIKTTILKLNRPGRGAPGGKRAAALTALWGELGVHLLLAAVLGGAAVLDSRAPFAAALVGAAGPGLAGAAALLGACGGYLLFLPLSRALRYLSASILIYAAAFAFYDLRPIRAPWAMPLLSGGLVWFTGFLVGAQQGWGYLGKVHLLLEVLLTVLAARCYREALSPAGGGFSVSPARKAGTLALLSTLLIALVTVPDSENLNPGRVLAVLLLLCAARQGGPAPGAAVGAAFGLACDLAGGLPLRCALFSLMGLAGGLCRGQARWRAALSAGGVTLLTGLWLWGSSGAPELLAEGLLGCLLLLPLPEALLRKLTVWVTADHTVPTDLRAGELARRRLEDAARAFRSLSDSLSAAFRPRGNDNDVASVFDRAANRVCPSCPLRGRCWEQDYTTTFNALNDATAPMVERGRAEAGDFPSHFSDRCIHFPELLTAVNEELTSLFYRRQYNARIRDSRQAVCRQYGQLSELLSCAAEELSRELTPDLCCDRLVRRRMTELGLEVRTAVFRDSRGLLRLQAEGPDVKELARQSRIADLGRLLDAPLRVEDSGDSSLSLLQLEPLMAVAGVAARKKSGETVSGDSGTYFKRPDGVLYLLLCDGMGTGPEASRESNLAIRLLEQFLMAGVETGHALATLASALALRGEETGGFTTVDLLQTDLFTGDCVLYKLGAAPTYVKKGDSIRRYLGLSLPAGLAEGTPGSIDRFAFHLEPGDCVLMVSDGVCTAEDDGWAQEQLRQFSGDSPKELARSLILDAPQQPPDDRTALVIRLERRRP